jgi:hypothetical protein
MQRGRRAGRSNRLHALRRVIRFAEGFRIAPSQIIPDASARPFALQAGEVDYLDQCDFPSSAQDALAKDPRFALKDVSYPSLDV